MWIELMEKELIMCCGGGVENKYLVFAWLIDLFK